MNFQLGSNSLETLLAFFYSPKVSSAPIVYKKPANSVNKLKVVMDQPSFRFSANLKDGRFVTLAIDASQVFLINEPLGQVTHSDITGNIANNII